MRTLGAVAARWLLAITACAVPSIDAAPARAVDPLEENPVDFPPWVQWESVEHRFQSPEPLGPAPAFDGKNADAIGPGKPDGAAPSAEEDADLDALSEEDYVDHDGPHESPMRRLFGCLLPPLHGRYRNAGHPLHRESWRNRPLSISWFIGGYDADQLIPGVISTGTGFFTGIRLGWDYSHFGGLETRFGGTKVALGYPADPFLEGDANFFVWDSAWLWYPWGDTQWRPFFTVGLGLVDIKFRDQFQSIDHDAVFGIPIGGGFKYRWDNRIAFRLDLLDNIAFASGNGLSDMNNFSITGSLEFRFGGATRRSYWPWNPSREWW